jgi:hypothetical protein
MMRKLLIPLGGLALSSVVVASLLESSSSCSFVVKNTTATQCQSTTDCAALGGAVAQYVCNPQNFCVPQAAYCTTNAQCNAASPGKPSICRKTDNTCQQLFTDDGACYAIMDGQQTGHADVVTQDPGPADIALLNDDNVIVAGTMIFTTPAGTAGGAQVLGGIALETTVAMVVQQYLSQLQGVPTATAGVRRPLVFVACSEGNDGTKDPLRTAAHLVNDLQVPIIIGPEATQEAYPVAASAAVLPAGTGMILPFDQSPLTRSVPNSNLLFRLDPGQNWLDLTRNQLNSYVEPWIKAQYNLANIKVVVTAPTDILSQADSQLAENELVFNGLPAQQNGGNFKVISTGDGTPGNPQQAIAAQDISTFAPNVIYMAGEPTEFLQIPLIESAWNPQTPYRPWYLLPATGVVAIFSDPAAVVGQANLASWRRRMLAQAFIPNPASAGFPSMLTYLLNYASLQGRAQQYPANPIFGVWVDATVLTLTGITSASLHQTPNADGSFPRLTGAEVAQAIQTATQPPNTKQLTYSDATLFTDMYTALQSQGGINYNGISGPCDFDATNDAWAEQTSLCFADDNATIVAGQSFRVEAPALGEMYTAQTQGQACYSLGACVDGGGTAVGFVDPGPGNPDAGSPGCNYGLPDNVVNPDAGGD